MDKDLNLFDFDKSKIEIIARHNNLFYIVDPNDGGKYVMPDMKAVDEKGLAVPNKRAWEGRIVALDKNKKIKYTKTSPDERDYPMMMVVSQKIYDKIIALSDQGNNDFLKSVAHYTSNEFTVDKEIEELKQIKQDSYLTNIKLMKAWQVNETQKINAKNEAQKAAYEKRSADLKRIVSNMKEDSLYNDKFNDIFQEIKRILKIVDEWISKKLKKSKTKEIDDFEFITMLDEIK